MILRSHTEEWESTETRLKPTIAQKLQIAPTSLSPWIAVNAEGELVTRPAGAQNSCDAWKSWIAMTRSVKKPSNGRG